MPAGRPVVRRAIVLLLATLLGIGALAAPAPAAPTAPTDSRSLFLVTLAGPGLAGSARPTGGVVPPWLQDARMRAEQDALLQAVGAGPPTYRWTYALNGFAAELTGAQAERLAAEPGVALVERNRVRPLAAELVPGEEVAAGLLGSRRTRGGAGVVIGFVDTGIAPDHPVFAPVPDLGGTPEGFWGECQPGEDWTVDTCNAKLVGAAWFVDGFGRTNLRSASSLSALDENGHGTQMASIAAGNAGLSVRERGVDLGTYAGVAPQARIAAYKACWTAPDPDDDGCATADLVSAIDRAAADGVDVLNLSVGGASAGVDTVERALLGAAEADIVVVASAGSGARAAHDVPWVTTVGGATGALPRGVVQAGSRLTMEGVTSATRGVGPVPLVIGADAPVRPARRADARRCLPGSLDAAAVAGRVVLCERGGGARLDKSRAVREADGVGMVLANPARGTLDPDFHHVPTVHLGARDGGQLRRWAAAHPGGRVTLRPSGTLASRPRAAAWSAPGRRGRLVEPDLLGPGTALVGAVPRSVRDARWDVVTGTSAATAYTSGVAALLRARRSWSAPTVRSALVTTSQGRRRSPVLQYGAGLLDPAAAGRPGLVLPIATTDYRAWLGGGRALNAPSVAVRAGRGRRVVTRTITNVLPRARYFSSAARGFDRVSVDVVPAAVRLDPGESARFRVIVRGRGRDDGYVVWHGATGTTTRMPVLVGR